MSRFDMTRCFSRVPPYVYDDWTLLSPISMMSAAVIEILLSRLSRRPTGYEL